MDKLDEVNVRYVKCTFCGWNHSYDASIADNANDAWEKANRHAMECKADPRNAELSALRERVAGLEAHTNKLIGLALCFNEDDPWIFERYEGVEIVSNAQNFLKGE